ncbi:hypothetical protein FRC11_001491, partial [Ceratobasidium sp. 423]
MEFRQQQNLATMCFSCFLQYGLVISKIALVSQHLLSAASAEQVITSPLPSAYQLEALVIDSMLPEYPGNTLKAITKLFIWVIGQ